MTKKRLVIIGLLLVLSLVAYLAYEHYQKAEKERYSYSVYTGKVRVKDYAFIENGKAVALQVEEDVSEEAKKVRQYSPKAVQDNIVPIAANDQYVIFQEANLKKGFPEIIPYVPEAVQKGQGESLNLVVYEKRGSNLEFKKTIDLFKLQERENQIIKIIPVIKMLTNSHQGLSISLGEKGKFIDLEEEVVEDYSLYSGEPFYTYLSKNDKVFYNLSNNVDGKTPAFSQLGETSIRAVSTIFDRATLKKIGEGLPIASRYPDAYSLLLKPQSSLTMMIDSSKVDIQADIDVLKLFTNDDIFSNLLIYSFNAIDNQEHIVNSYDEFMQYYNFEMLD